MKNIMMDISNQALRLANNKVYYFDTNGIYQSVPVCTALEMNISNICFVIYKDRQYFDPYNFFKYAFPLSNRNLVRKAISTLKEGDTVETLDYYLSALKMNKRPKPEGINRFVISIDKPIFVQIPENPNPNTFDYIRIIVNIVTEWDQDRKTYIKNHVKDINKMILQKLEKNKQFQRFNVPVNFLTVSNITFSAKSNILEYIFEIKEISS